LVGKPPHHLCAPLRSKAFRLFRYPPQRPLRPPTACPGAPPALLTAASRYAACPPIRAGLPVISRGAAPKQFSENGWLNFTKKQKLTERSAEHPDGSMPVKVKQRADSGGVMPEQPASVFPKEAALRCRWPLPGKFRGSSNSGCRPCSLSLCAVHYPHRGVPSLWKRRYGYSFRSVCRPPGLWRAGG
jgi:hypothetical protein